MRIIIKCLATAPNTMQEKIDEGVAKGYSVTAGTRGEQLTIIMEKTARASEYLLLVQHDTASLEREIKDAARRCFHPVSRTLLFTKRSGDGWLPIIPGTILLAAADGRDGPIIPMLALRRGSQADQGLIVIMEKTAQCEPFEYKVIGTQRVGTFKKELTQVAGEGFEIIGMTFSHEQVALLRRLRSTNHP